MNDYIKQLNWRVAIKSFDSTKKLSEEQLDLLIEAARLAPSSYGLQPFKLIVVTDPKIKKELTPATYDQQQVEDSSATLVLAINKEINEDLINKYAERIKTARNQTDSDVAGLKSSLINAAQKRTQKENEAWASKQAYIALGFILDAAAQNNIDACPMGGFDADKYDEILGLSDLGLHATVICTVGFRSKDDKYSNKPKVRMSKEEFVIKR